MIYRGDPEEDFEWMSVIHEAQKVFIGSVYHPPQGSSISNRFIYKVLERSNMQFLLEECGQRGLPSFIQLALVSRASRVAFPEYFLVVR